MRGTRTRGRGRPPLPVPLFLLPSFPLLVHGHRANGTRAWSRFSCAMVCVHPVCDPSSLWPGSCHEKTESRPFTALAKRDRGRERFRLSVALAVARRRSIQPFEKREKEYERSVLSCSRSLNRDRGRILGRGAARRHSVVSSFSGTTLDLSLSPGIT